MNWISVEDKLPGIYIRFLAYKHIYTTGFPEDIYVATLKFRPENNQYYFEIVHSDSTVSIRWIKEFSHWMPLPEKPKEK